MTAAPRGAAGSRRLRARVHGLTATYLEEAEKAAVDGLTGLLLEGVPDTAPIRAAARDAALAMHRLRAIRRLRLDLIERARRDPLAILPERAGKRQALLIEVLRTVNIQLARRFACYHGKGISDLLAHIFRQLAPRLRTLAAYERKALSRRARAIRRLDYEILEARRHGP